MIGLIDAKYRQKKEHKKREWGKVELTRNHDGSISGYEEYLYPITNREGETYEVKGVVRWWRKN